MRQKYQQISDNARSFLSQHYNHEQNTAFVEERKERFNILKGFYSHALDAGVLHNRNFRTVEGEDLPTAQGVPLFNRASFSQEILRKISTQENAHLQYDGKTPLTIVHIDIANLRSADYMDVNGNKSADWILNNVAKVIQEVSASVLPSDETKSYATCRYGGDEFSIALIGDYGTGLAQKITELEFAINNKLTDIYGYYKVIGREFKESLRINREKIEVVTMPESGIDQDIFYSFLVRGIMLPKEQIGRIKKKLNVNDYGEGEGKDRLHEYLDDMKKPKKIYPPEIDVSKIKNKMDYLISIHPELEYIITLASTLDYEEEQELKRGLVITRQSQVVLFIENVMYDTLLRENVYTRTDFAEHIMDGEFKKLFVFDLKFIKEINEKLSYVDGDEAIIKLWSVIKKAVPIQELRKFTIARYGGTIILGLRNDENILPEIISSLHRINTISLPDSFDFAIPIGFGSINLEGMSELSVEETESMMYLDTAINDAANSWYGLIFNYLNDSIHEEDLKFLEDNLVYSPEKNVVAILEEVSMKGFLLNFFTKKRTLERITAMFDVMKKIPDDNRVKKYFDNLLKTRSEMFSALMDLIMRHAQHQP